jgi:hypothetical protein
MASYDVIPDVEIESSGIISDTFLKLGIGRFRAACRYVHELPYGYNSNREDLLILFKEKKGTCTTKHAVIATLARELRIPIEKHVGIYAMTEALVSGTDVLLKKHQLPYIPMIHCFLVYTDGPTQHNLDLSEGNRNGKKGPIKVFLHSQQVEPNISAKDEYMLFRNAVQRIASNRGELKGVELKTILRAREDGLILLKSFVE